MNILLFLIILVVLIVVHEFGHFFVAKRLGIRVDEFGIGFPPRALKLWRKGETDYTLNWLPFGGFVKIFGENPDDESINGPDSERSFVHKPKWVQVAVLAAGVTFNVVLAWLIFVGVFMAGSLTPLSEGQLAAAEDVQLTVVHVLDDSPASRAGLTVGDTVIGVISGTEEVHELTPSAVTTFISEREHEPITFSIERDGEVFESTVVPEVGVIVSDEGRPAIGASMGFTGDFSLPLHKALWEATVLTGDMLKAITVALSTFLFGALTLSADLSQIAGPVGIVGLVGEAASLGVVSVLMFTAFISLNLAIINLIPVPALDGGRIVFVLIEAIKGSPIKPTVANALNMIGFVLLILLMVAVTFSDISKIVG